MMHARLRWEKEFDTELMSLLENITCYEMHNVSLTSGYNVNKICWNLSRLAQKMHVYPLNIQYNIWFIRIFISENNSPSA